MVKNRRGQNAPTSLMLIFFVFLAFLGIIFMGIITYGANVFDGLMSKLNVQVGSVNFNDTYNNTIKPVIINMNSNIDIGGIALILGMIVVMLVCGFSFREGKSRLFIIIDIFIIIVSFIISVVLQNSYNTVIHASDDLLNVYSNNLPKSSTFLLRLPLSIAIIGVLIMIVTYATINKKKEVNVYDYVEQ